MPKFRIEHIWGEDVIEADGTFDFDGGTLIVWKDKTRTYLIASYGPSTQWILTHEPEEKETHRGPIHIE